MKKTTVICLALLLIVGFLGCSGPRPQELEPDFTEQPIAAGAVHSDFEGLSVQAGGIYIYPDKTTLVVVWNNKTEYSVIYGEAFWLERWENGEWVDCAVTEPAFRSEAYSLSPNRLKNHDYLLSGLYDVSTPGTYRFRTICDVDMGAVKETGCTLWSEFIVL